MTILQKLGSGVGYTWAALCLLIVLATFMGLSFWEQTLAKGTGIHVSARFSGGEVLQTIDHGFYRTLRHRPVFDGLLSDRAEGFVQIDWVPSEKQPLPSIVKEDLDIDGDGRIDLSVEVETSSGKVQLIRNAPWVLGPEPLISADSERILRVRLQNLLSAKNAKITER
jgi:hypothetical protein